jgi:quinol monooxygenase YgiN
VATILAHITVKAGREEEFERIARDLFVESHAHDEGLLRYEYWRGSDPSSYYSLLSFHDFRAFIAHQTSDHHELASPLIGDVVMGIRLEWVDPVDGASNLPRTSAQELSGDLDELTKLYARRFAVRESQWWQSLRGDDDE